MYDTEHDDRRQYTASAITDKRQCDTGQGNKSCSAANRQKYLKYIDCTDPYRNISVKIFFQLHGNLHKYDKAADTDKNQTDSEYDAHLFRHC